MSFSLLFSTYSKEANLFSPASNVEDRNNRSFFDNPQLLSMQIIMDYTKLNQDFWKESLKSYNFPTENVFNFTYGFTMTFMSKDFYFETLCSFGGSEKNKTDSLKSSLSSGKMSLFIGYNLLFSMVIFTPYLGITDYYQKHIIKQNNEQKTIDQWQKFPDLTLSNDQMSMVIGSNIIIPIYKGLIVSSHLGYNYNLYKNANLSLGKSALNCNYALVKNLYFTIGIGFDCIIYQNSNPNYF